MSLMTESGEHWVLQATTGSAVSVTGVAISSTTVWLEGAAVGVTEVFVFWPIFACWRAFLSGEGVVAVAGVSGALAAISCTAGRMSVVCWASRGSLPVLLAGRRYKARPVAAINNTDAVVERIAVRRRRAALALCVA